MESRDFLVARHIQKQSAEQLSAAPAPGGGAAAARRMAAICG